MCAEYRDAEWEAIKDELQTEGCRALLANIAASCPEFQTFQSWAAAAMHIHALPADSSEKDQLLSGVFLAIQSHGTAGYQAVLLALFWPELRSLYRKKRRWDKNPESRWVNAVWAFLHAVDRFDPEARTSGISRKLINDTDHELYRIYKAEWDLLEIERPTAPDEILNQHDRPEEASLLAAAPESPRDFAIANLRSNLESGRIDQLDFQLIFESRVQGKSLEACAADAGVSYQAAQRRRNRAEVLIQKFNAQSGIFSDSLSDPSNLPPFPL